MHTLLVFTEIYKKERVKKGIAHQKNGIENCDEWK